MTNTEKATFAAGCFWGVEEYFRQLPGVLDTKVGYCNGHTPNPTYEEVCGNTTGHAEAIEIDYDASIINFQDLLDAFFNIHDPTTLNRQGPDIGSQYRSAVFYHTAQQQQLAQATIEKLNASGRYSKPIVTEITPAETFYPAEEYHQRYYQKKGGGSCALF